jgi:osmotically-inducible protein OsmY
MSTYSLNHTLALIAAGAMLINSTPLSGAETDDRIESSFRKLSVYKIDLKDDAIKTESRNGVVTLTGQVNEPSHKYLAQEAVAGLPGVQRVDNRLEVKLEGTEKSDTWIRAKVRSVLALHRHVSGSSTQVDIRDGVITLRGVATSEAQKDLATEYAKDVQGVLLVTNVMTVVKAPAKTDEMVFEPIDDASINAHVKVALLLHHSTSSVDTTVRTSDSVVTVSGMAKNLAEKTLVTKLATDIIGVKNVVNLMTVAP